MSPRRPRVPRVDPALPAPTPAEPGVERARTDAPVAAEPVSTPAVAPVSTPVTSTDPTPAATATPASEPVPAVRPTAPARTASPRTTAPRPAPRREAAARQQAAAAARHQAEAAARRRAPLPEPVPARQITGRSLLVVGVLLLAVMLVAPTLRVFLNQQLEISATREDIAQQREQQAAYEAEIRRWDDPAYVAQQARDRLDLVMPGETLYTVTGLDEAAGDAPAETAEDAAARTDVVNDRLPWVEGLWDSVIRSGTE